MSRCTSPSEHRARLAWAGLIGALGAGALGIGGWSPGEEARSDPLAEQLEHRLAEDVAPILAEYCYGCHGPRKAKGGIRFDELQTMDQVLRMGDDLAIARELVSTGEMPPDDEPSPSDHQRLIVKQWLDDALAYYPQNAAPDPGWFTIHRLNRTEYRLTMRDLLGVDPEVFDLAEGLPPDDIGYGFDNIADVLAVSPLHLEAYLEAAERAIELGLGPVVEAGVARTPVRLTDRPRNGRAIDRGGFMLYSNGAVGGRYPVPATAEYEVIVTAWGTPGGDEQPRLSLRVDGKEVAWFWVEARQAEPGEYRVALRLEAGLHHISGHFTNDYYVRGVADRNLAVVSIEVAGPTSEDSIQRPQAWHDIFDIRPNGVEGREAARSVITRFADKAYRRPVEPSEVGSLMALFDSARATGESWESSVRLALTAALVSPNFLYRSVANPFPDDPGHVYRLSDHELASRLSYFLWSSIPDEELRQLADNGQLDDDDTLCAQVRRMLDDPKADAFIENFAGQWLQLRNLQALEIDRRKYPLYDDDLRRSMVREAELFFGDVVRNDHRISAFIDSPYTYIDGRLAALYGIEGVEGDEFRRVNFGDSSVRGGVLAMGAVLTVTSNPTRTSPVKRGLFVLEEILGNPPPPPPPDIPPLEQVVSENSKRMSLREQLSAHLTDPVCASCHRRMDPIGLAMENFDAIGAWRDSDAGMPIDASGELPGGIIFEGPEGLKQILLAREESFVENLTRKLMTYALGRGMEPFDRPTVYRIARQAEQAGGRFSAIIEGIVLSETFRTCRGRTRDD